MFNIWLWPCCDLKLATYNPVVPVISAQVVDAGSLLPNFAVLNLIVRVNMGLSGWTQFGLVWGQFGGFQTFKLYRLIG